MSERLFFELSGLARAAGARVAATLHARRRRPDPATFLGKGKTGELAAMVKALSATLVIVDQALTPIQERNLERNICCRVIDRTRLILDIFSLRARSREGQLQVELAQLRYLSTRLVRGWTHLERQRGGIGLRGPGETQLETDRRLLGARISRLKKQLIRVRGHRELIRQRRRGIPTMALVGYTNAGKSSLFNCLTAAEVAVADQLFATLDPTTRRVQLPGGGAVLMSDTVGFIQGLPATLVDAFRATLEELTQASLLLHVVDAADEDHMEQSRQVDDTLREIGAGEIPRIVVLNKIDCIETQPTMRISSTGGRRSVAVSAITGLGLNDLRQAIAERLSGLRSRRQVRLPPSRYRLRAQVYSLATVASERIDPDGHCVLDIEIAPESEGRLMAQAGFKASYWIN